MYWDKDHMEKLSEFNIDKQENSTQLKFKTFKVVKNTENGILMVNWMFCKK